MSSYNLSFLLKSWNAGDIPKLALWELECTVAPKWTICKIWSSCWYFCSISAILSRAQGTKGKLSNVYCGNKLESKWPTGLQWSRLLRTKITLLITGCSLLIGMLDVGNDEANFLQPPFKPEGQVFDTQKIRLWMEYHFKEAYLSLMALESAFFLCEQSQVIFEVPSKRRVNMKYGSCQELEDFS